jgi:hypothetical protein
VHSIFVGTGGASATGGSSAAGAAGAATMDAGNVTVPSSGGATAITDAGAPLGLCAHSEQLQCTWGANPLTCSCNLSAPLSGNDCPPCAAFYCHSYAPNVGCQCVICIR